MTLTAEKPKSKQNKLNVDWGGKAPFGIKTKEVFMAKKNNRKRSTGWAYTKKYPHF